MDGIKTIEIQISAVDNVEGPRFEDELIEDFDVVDLAMGDNNEAGDTSPEIQESMQFHGTFVGSELGPREKRETQIDGRGVQGVGGLIQFDAEGIVGVEATSLADEDLGKVGIDSPISDLVGMSQSIARNVRSEAHMIEFLLGRTETGLDVSEAFPVCQLSKGHAEKLVPARKVFDLVVAVVSLNAFLEFVDG
jgi:hypothetical protein